MCAVQKRYKRDMNIINIYVTSFNILFLFSELLLLLLFINFFFYFGFVVLIIINIICFSKRKKLKKKETHIYFLLYKVNLYYII